MLLRIAASLGLALTLVGGLAASALAVTFENPGPTYDEQSDSPFATTFRTAFASGQPGVDIMYADGSDYFYLETLQDGALNVPGVSMVMGVISTDGNTDSIDEDDGMVDGAVSNPPGNPARSFFNSDSTDGVQFDFDGTALGHFPTHVGVVWTDGNTGTFRVRYVVAGSGTTQEFALQISSGGQVDEDRFLGLTDPNGVGFSSLTVRRDTSFNFGGIEVDHLQYGFLASDAVIPEPSTLALALLILAGALAAVRRRPAASAR